MLLVVKGFKSLKTLIMLCSNLFGNCRHLLTGRVTVHKSSMFRFIVLYFHSIVFYRQNPIIYISLCPNVRREQCSSYFQLDMNNKFVMLCVLLI